MSVVAIVVGMKIARSRVLGICVCCNHNKLVDIGEKLVSAHFELLNRTHEHYKLCIFCSACLWFTDCTYSAPHAFCSCAQLQLR